MLKAGRLKLLPGYLICALAFLIPFPFIFSSVAIIVLSIAWLVQINGKEFLTNFKNRPMLWVWIGYYLVHALSYFYSSNKEQSVFDLQMKLSLLILPLIVGTAHTSRAQVERVFLLFVAGLTVMALFYLGRGTGIWLKTGDASHFFYHDLVGGYDAHAVYMSWYTLIAISVLLFLPLRHYFSNGRQWIRLALFALFIAFFLLLSSRTLILVLIFFVIPLYLLRHSKSLPRPAIIASVAVFIAMVVTLFATNNPIKSRYDSIVHNDLHNAWLEDYSKVDESRFSNLTVRVFVWRMGFENMRDGNLWLTGVGNGDVKEAQNKKMMEYGVRHLSEEFEENRSGFYNLNLHNMFMQSLVMVGIPGLLLLIGIVFTPFIYFKFLSHNLAFLVFHIVSLLFMMQEAALQSQAGVVFYGLFSQLFWSAYFTTRENKTTENQ